MHRISDPRVSGVSRKNLRMFSALCGKENLGNVRIVTTNWSRVTEEEGSYRETDLKNGAFKALVDAGAQMRRHSNTLESALRIMSELISLQPMTLTIQEELRAGKTLMDTGAGKVLAEGMEEMKKKHERELAGLEREMNDAEEEKNRSLIAELEQEREVLQEKMERAKADWKKLESTLGAVHVDAAGEQGNFTKLRERNKDASGALKAVGGQPKDPLSPEHRCANRSSELSVRDAPEHDGMAHLPSGEFPGTLSDPLRVQESWAAELRIREMETDLQTLQARIRDAETKRDRWARASKKVMKGLHWLTGELMGALPFSLFHPLLLICAVYFFDVLR